MSEAPNQATLDRYLENPRGVVPGDGVQTVWPMVLGRNRARYFLLMGQKLSAQELLECGAVNEVLPKEQLMDRAWEVARYLATPAAKEAFAKIGHEADAGGADVVRQRIVAEQKSFAPAAKAAGLGPK